MLFKMHYTLPVQRSLYLGPIQKYRVLNAFHLTTMHAFDILTSSTLITTASVASEREWILVVFVVVNDMYIQ